jgi:hypothetical protein
MTAGALSRREPLVLGVGLTVLSLVARLAECLDPHHHRDRRWSTTRVLATQYPHKPTRR